MKKYILFDNDGVLVETEIWYFEANKNILKKELALNLEFDEYMKIMARGGTAWEIAKKDGVSQKVIDSCRAKRDVLYQDFITTKDVTIPNVNKIIKKLNQKYKMAIITTSRREDFELIHKSRGITEYMQFCLCVGEYKRAKPYADPYLAGVKKFNAKKKECIVVEDSQRGLTSAVNAGIECVVVHNEFTKTQDYSKADYKIKTLDELENLLEIT